MPGSEAILKKVRVREQKFRLLAVSNRREKKFGRGFSSKTKNTLFRGFKIVVFEAKILNLFLCVCSFM